MIRFWTSLWVVIAVAGFPAAAQDDVFDEVLGAGPGVDPTQPWDGWYGPWADGLLDLRFGMDRVTVLRRMGERELESAAARDGRMRFEGQLLGEAAEVLLSFTDADDRGPTGRLKRIEVKWNVFGVPQKPKRLFERIDGLLRSRYGDPVRTQDDGYAALDAGNGHVRNLYRGSEARAQADLQAYRPDRFWVILALESPQLAGVE